MKKTLGLAEVKKIKHGGFRSLLTRALELGVEIRPLSSGPRILELRLGKKSVFCVNSTPPLLKRMGNTTKNKVTTKIILHHAGISTPRGVLVSSVKEAFSELKKAHLHYPLISKPLNSSLATGVSWNIQTEKELRAGIAHIEAAQKKYKKMSKSFLIEEMIQGDEYRVLVFNGVVLSCVKKVPATVIGDGARTIEGLIKKFNQTRKLGFKIKIDDVVLATLQKNKLSLQSVLPKDFVLRLRNNLNMSDGGRSIEVTEEMHPALKKICIQAIEALGMHYGGIDLITPDIASTKSRYAIIEVNSNPYFNMHEKSLVEGTGIDVSQILLEDLFPALTKRKK